MTSHPLLCMKHFVHLGSMTPRVGSEECLRKDRETSQIEARFMKFRQNACNELKFGEFEYCYLRTQKSTQIFSELLLSNRKRSFLYCCILIHCCRDVFTAPLRSSESGADHREHRFSIVACVLFCGNVFTEPLPSNKLFKLSGVMSQYIIRHMYSVKSPYF
jgi:hypothetical protein